ncbi:MAG: hypothetical protein AB1921_16775 [Thermodesulfobacteriota bacterium]
MGWFRKIFSRDRAGRLEETKQERPADWNLTLEALIAEMEAGKRKSIGNSEMRWALDYEQSLLPQGIRFPQKGDLYESKKNQTIQFLTAWAAPFTGGGEAELRKGERIWVHSAPRGEKPLSTYALPVEYGKLESRMVPGLERKAPKYTGFYLSIKTTDLNENFELIETGFEGDIPETKGRTS